MRNASSSVWALGLGPVSFLCFGVATFLLLTAFLGAWRLVERCRDRAAAEADVEGRLGSWEGGWREGKATVSPLEPQRVQF